MIQDLFFEEKDFSTLTVFYDFNIFWFLDWRKKIESGTRFWCDLYVGKIQFFANIFHFGLFRCAHFQNFTLRYSKIALSSGSIFDASSGAVVIFWSMVAAEWHRCAMLVQHCGRRIRWRIIVMRPLQCCCWQHVFRIYSSDQCYFIRPVFYTNYNSDNMILNNIG